MNNIIGHETSVKGYKINLLNYYYYYYHLYYYYYYYYYTCERFSLQLYPMISHWSLNDSMSPQVSRTLLSILTDLNKAVVWMVSTPPIISKSSSIIINVLTTLTIAPITIDITVSLMFHRFFNSLAMSRYSSFFSFSFNFTLWSAGTTKSTICQVRFFFIKYY